MNTSPNYIDQNTEKTIDERLLGSPLEERIPRFYRRMFFIRRFEQLLLSLFEEGLLNGTTHAYIGQEANAVGIIDNLLPGDHIFSNHRCHGHYLARTGDARGLLAEIMGKEEGICSGIGGSQHICAQGFKSNGVQGGIVPAAAGIALANKLKQTDDISAVFIGDGTLGEGIVYETLNIASLWKLPLFVVVENNLWAQSTPLRLNFAGDMTSRFSSFNFSAREIETTDVLEVAKAAKEELSALREHGYPRALIVHTYRLCSHSKNDDARPEPEVKERWKREPLALHAKRLEEAQKSVIETQVEQALEEIISELRG